MIPGGTSLASATAPVYGHHVTRWCRLAVLFVVLAAVVYPHRASAATAAQLETRVRVIKLVAHVLVGGSSTPTPEKHRGSSAAYACAVICLCACGGRVPSGNACTPDVTDCHAPADGGYARDGSVADSIRDAAPTYNNAYGVDLKTACLATGENTFIMTGYSSLSNGTAVVAGGPNWSMGTPGLLDDGGVPSVYVIAAGHWTVQLMTAPGNPTPLHPGNYDNATNYGSPETPEVSVIGPWGCDMIKGSFTILDFTLGDAGLTPLVSFTALFTEYCLDLPDRAMARKASHARGTPALGQRTS